MDGSNNDDVSVVICVHTEKRWPHILAAVASCKSQSLQPTAIILVVDHNMPLRDALRGVLVDVIVLENRYGQGLCGGRNTGIEAVTTRFVAFLDDDAEAAVDWLSNLVACLQEPTVFAAGGVSRPVWETSRPMWMPDEFLWTLGCSYRGMPSKRAEVRSLFGGCMCVRHSLFQEIGGFDERLGRGSGSVPIGGEEAEFFMRAREASRMRRFIYDPSAAIAHKVSDRRTSFAYFVTRCYAEGLCKAALSRISSNRYCMAAEFEYTYKVLPAGVAGRILDGVKGNASSIAQACAIIIGFTATLFGYVLGRLTLRARCASNTDGGVRIPAAPFRELSKQRTNLDVA